MSDVKKKPLSETIPPASGADAPWLLGQKCCDGKHKLYSIEAEPTAVCVCVCHVGVCSQLRLNTVEPNQTLNVERSGSSGTVSFTEPSMSFSSSSAEHKLLY